MLDYGTLFLRMMMPFFLCQCANQVYAGSLRGVGNTKAPMIIMMSCFIVFRQIYLFIISRLTESVIWVALGYPFGWILCSVIIYIYYKRCDLKKYRVVAK